MNFPICPKIFSIPHSLGQITDTVVLGSNLATREKGQKIIDKAIDTIVNILKKHTQKKIREVLQ